MSSFPRKRSDSKLRQIWCRNTPDNWVPRDTRLIRLTGKHPFNTEAPLRDLVDAGFLTPSNLFYVRNHGAVPQCNQERADNWTLRIHGLVEQEHTFTIQDLISRFQVVTLPITLVCAGNRRREQNGQCSSSKASEKVSGLTCLGFVMQLLQNR